jgi:hypothetical protein
MIPKPEQMYQMNAKCTKWSWNIQIVSHIFQMAIKYSNIFQSKALKSLPKLGFCALKINHLATLIRMQLDRFKFCNLLASWRRGAEVGPFATGAEVRGSSTARMHLRRTMKTKLVFILVLNLL